MQKLRAEKGITLIALIITIIVMLILVGVTVSISLNGGLFTTAKQATNKTQLELDKEQLLEIAIGTIGRNGKVDYDELTEAVQGKFTVTGYGEDATYTSKSGNKFVVNNWGGVIEAPTVAYISGKWKFKTSPEHISGSPDGEILNQDVSFVATGISSEYGADGEELTVSMNCDNITVTHSHYDSEECYLEIYYGEVAAYVAMAWEWNIDQKYDNDGLRTVDFGSTQKPVSKEFYDWFTANATQVQ